MSVAIVDLTRCYPGTASYYYSAALASEHAAREETYVIATHKQFAELDAAVGVRPPVQDKRIEFPDYHDFNVIAERVGGLVEKFAAETPVAVFSFHGVVLDLEAKFQSTDFDVDFVHLGHLGRSSGASRVWPERLAPIDVAVGHLRSALRRAGAVGKASGIRQTSLRPMLVAEARDIFDKTNPAARAPGIISALVDAAVEQGVAEMTADEHQNPFVWLAPGSGQVEEQRDVEVSAILQDEAKAAALGFEQQIRSSESRNGDPSERLLSILKEVSRGPFSEVRSRLFDAIEARVRDSERLTVFELVEFAERVVLENSDEWIEKESLRRKYPYRRVRDFIITMMSRSPVLLDSEGRALSPTLAEMQSEVAGLAPEWRLRLESELILILAERGFELSAGDIPVLAGVIKLDRNGADARSEVAEMLSYLLRERRLVEKAGTVGTYVLAKGTSEVRGQ